MKLCGVCIITNDVLRLAAFYKEVFCIEPVGNEIHSAFDEMQLAIWNPGNVNVETKKNISLMYFVDNADYEYERLHKISGIKILSHPKTRPWGVKAFSFKDLDGNIVDFLEKINNFK